MFRLDRHLFSATWEKIKSLSRKVHKLVININFMKKAVFRT